MISDTHPKAAEVQIELIRRATTAERFERVRSLTRLAVSHARRAIARAYPECTPRDQDLKFVEIHYGPALAVAVRDYLDQRIA